MDQVPHDVQTRHMGLLDSMDGEARHDEAIVDRLHQTTTVHSQKPDRQHATPADHLYAWSTLGEWSLVLMPSAMLPGRPSTLI